MSTGLYQSIALLAIVIAYYTMDGLLIARYDRERQAEGSGRSWSYTLMILALVAFMIAQPIVLPWLGWPVPTVWGAVLQVIGLGLNVGALLLHAWARLHLRKFYAERVEVQPDHLVVDSGPYAYVRHPVFTSFFMHAIGLLLINPSVPTVLIALYTFWDFSHAARQEENLLSQRVPGYTDYMARTARFFPALFRRSRGKAL